MRVITRDISHNNQNSKGFSLVEIIVVLAILSMGSVLLGALMKQLSNFSKSSKQVGTMLEIRTMANSFIKDPERTKDWLDTMRGKEALYSSCIPPNESTPSSINCPAPDTHLKAELGDVANGYHVISAPIYSDVGVKVAGDVNAPVLMSSEGTACLSPDHPLCTLKATGYFLRTNAATSGSPGNVKFIMKVEKRPAPESIPMKPQFITMNVGSEWDRTLGTCPASTVKMGTLGNGQPHCVPIATNCPTGKIAVGINSDGSPKCVTTPNCAPGQFASISSDGNLDCSSARTPCPAGAAHLGFYSGTQTPICSTSLAGCPSGQLQTGIDASGATVTPICKTLPPCNDPLKKLSYDGASFSCVEDAGVAGKNCPDGKIMSGVRANGTLICRNLASSEDGEDGDDGAAPIFPVCANGTFLTTNAKGKLVCRPPGESGGTDGKDGGDGIDPTVTGLRATYTLVSPNTTEWACKHNVDIRDICGGPDGCYIRFNMQHKQNYDQTKTFETGIYIEQRKVSNNSFKGLFGHVFAQSSFILGDPNRIYNLASPWDWAYVTNYKPKACPGRTTHSQAYDDPFKVTLMVHPMVKARIIFRN